MQTRIAHEEDLDAVADNHPKSTDEAPPLRGYRPSVRTRTSLRKQRASEIRNQVGMRGVSPLQSEQAHSHQLPELGTGHS